MNTPSYNVLVSKDKLIKTTQELCETLNNLQNTVESNIDLTIINEDALLQNQLTEEQEKNLALNAVATMCVMYGYTTTTSQDPEYTEVIVDSEDKILMGRKVDGTLEIFGKIYS